MNFSVVITTYNRPDFLELSLKSVLSQTIKVSEITVIDDNSSVDYSSVLNKFNDQRIKYIKQSVSGGANVARNLGVEKSVGEVVAFLDDDDVWLPEYLDWHLHEYKEGADAVVSGFKHLGNENEIRVNEDSKVSKSSLLKGNTYCGMSGFSCKREILANTPFDITLNNGQDWDIFVRLYQMNVKFSNIPNPIFLYRYQNLDGIGTKLRKMNPKDIDRRLGSANKHKEFLGSYWYKKRVADQILLSLKYKTKKHKWLLLSLKKAGLVATLNFFLYQFKNKLLRRA
ncbi:glycosyltransferase family 2 protein [Alteromonas sp. Mac1]|uniref:glycosyltransferase family 2 protein n=1 Tax=Alteromonas sp. Mac1 TaxID=1777491 RepID=UPI0007706CC6|nr:glycosyltransferase family 2 protein [Alteromonas sp. Mac1]AMJ86442.1 glycosyl transferase [Alteromonas sp. Mac1]AMJ90301.1 glycosyl transferase [Alteromonas sp. Mac2]